MDKTLNRKDLTEGVVWKKLLIFFLPIAAGTCIQQLYNAVDGLIVGRYVGTVALAAVGGSSAQIINLLIGFFVAITAGASVVIAQVYGAGRTRDVQLATGNAIAVFSLLGLLLMAVGLIFSPALLRLLRTPEDTMADSILYLRIYFIGVPFILVLNMESNMLRSVGDSFSPFLYMVAGCLANIVLDVLFVVGFHWGTAGVAIATVLAQVLNMALLTAKLLRTPEPYRLSLRELKLKGVYLRNMLRLGIPSGLQSSMYAVSNMIIQIGVNSLGTVVVASWAMSGKVDGAFWAITSAFGTALTTFVGQNYGAGKLDRIRACAKKSLLLMTAMTLSVSGILLLIARPLLHLLTNDGAVIDTTWYIILLFVPFYLIWVPIEVFSGVLRGVGDVLTPSLILAGGICGFRILWLLTAFNLSHTLLTLCICYPLSWVVTDIAIYLYFRRSPVMTRAVRVIDSDYDHKTR